MTIALVILIMLTLIVAATLIEGRDATIMNQLDRIGDLNFALATMRQERDEAIAAADRKQALINQYVEDSERLLIELEALEERNAFLETYYSRRELDAQDVIADVERMLEEA